MGSLPAAAAAGPGFGGSLIRSEPAACPSWGPGLPWEAGGLARLGAGSCGDRAARPPCQSCPEPVFLAPADRGEGNACFQKTLGLIPVGAAPWSPVPQPFLPRCLVSIALLQARACLGSPGVLCQRSLWSPPSAAPRGKQPRSLSWSGGRAPFPSAVGDEPH